MQSRFICSFVLLSFQYTVSEMGIIRLILMVLLCAMPLSTSCLTPTQSLSPLSFLSRFLTIKYHVFNSATLFFLPFFLSRNVKIYLACHVVIFVVSCLCDFDFVTQVILSRATPPGCLIIKKYLFTMHNNNK